jgi:hypothetical protein
MCVLIPLLKLCTLRVCGSAGDSAPAATAADLIPENSSLEPEVQRMLRENAR